MKVEKLKLKGSLGFEPEKGEKHAGTSLLRARPAPELLVTTTGAGTARPRPGGGHEVHSVIRSLFINVFTSFYFLSHPSENARFPPLQELTEWFKSDPVDSGSPAGEER